ncbi:extracellular solute-binding protein [Paenibacillus eucommiae]|uniref:ABC-type glycerol-3-phosphate transport system substrate-binding protein n=1 Tax=Paenibacillus eucommiae TaxID=1355755 RepID=A0ABS4INC6_9BACL|nr:extracellular solute-binding protein [Paenibacillus eucommiae]MBP1989023.1 ABC-type glycerol-3-phosphate transport system substrate-binding protein [Paenibacillus eucommiae]
MKGLKKGLKNGFKTGMLIFLALTFLLAACSSNKESGSTPQPSDSTTKPEQTGEGKGDTPKGEKIKLNWLVPSQPNTNLPDPNKDFVKKMIEEKFNVELKLDYMIAGQDFINKTNLLLASTPPDMWRDGTPDGGNQYALDGLLADLTPFVTPETMPNYYKYWTTEKELKAYQVQNKFFRAPVPFDRNIYRTYYIRKDWLDNLKLEVPTSYDEYVDVLRKFRNDDPDGNKKKDTYGFTTAGGGATIGLDWPEYIHQGLTFPRKIENNQYVDMQTDARVEQVIDDITKRIAEDLIDPDWFLNKAPQHIEKAIQGKAGVILGSTANFALDSNPQGIEVRTKQLYPNANWVPMNIFPDSPMAVKPSPAGPFLFAKQVAEKDPEKVKRSIEILDWLASEEGYLLTHYGVEGQHYTREGSTIKLNVDAFTTDVIKQGDFLQIWQFFTPFEAPQIFNLSVLDPRQTDRDRDILQFFLKTKLNENEGVSFIPPQGFDLAGFRKRQSELQVKAILEDKSGKNWPQYREELMTKYKGNDLFGAYTEILRAAGAIK